MLATLIRITIIYLAISLAKSYATSSNLQFGSSAWPNRTDFAVFASNARSIHVRVYDQDGYQDYPMAKFEAQSSQLRSDLLAHTWVLSHPADLTGRRYHYIVQNQDSISYQILDERSITVADDEVDLFLFDPLKGFMVDTSAKGFRTVQTEESEIDLAGEIISKTVSDGFTTFKLKQGLQLAKYRIQVSNAGQFPVRIDGFPTADPYCLDLLEDNSCKIRSRPSRKLAQIGFRPGHTIHEVHLKDLTFLLPGIPEDIRGTYKAVSHPATLKMLKDMQVSTLEFLPVHSFDRNAAPPGHINYWGYMTRGFFALHRAYAHEQDRSIEEFQEAIEALHGIGIAVIMDVVYNHTSEGDHRGPTVSFKNLARDEYFRMWDSQKGYYLNSTGVGNTCKTESPVMRQLIIDSLTYFTEYFGIDGYRFDLGAAIDKQTLRHIREVLPEGTLLTGEPWVAADGAQWNRTDLNEINMGKWSDGFRRDVRGDYNNAGWINGEGNENSIKILLRGEDVRFGGSGSFVHANPGNINPFSVINEVEVHDGYTLYDWLTRFDVDKKTILGRMRLAHTLMMISVHTPILQLGQEFARTKKGNFNSYDEDSEINWIDWNRASQKYFKSLNQFTSDLKKLRLHYDAFHFNRRVDDERIIFINDKDNNQSAFGVLMRGSRYEFLILLNGSAQYGANFRFFNTDYDLISDGEKINPRGLDKIIGGHYYLHPTSSAILRREL